MFFIFGWGTGTTKDKGPAIPSTCSRCNEYTWFHYVIGRTWFTLFFVPLLPYDKREFLMCPLCSSAVEMFGEKKAGARMMHQAAIHLMKKKITQPEFNALADMTVLLSGQQKST